MWPMCFVFFVSLYTNAVVCTPMPAEGSRLQLTSKDCPLAGGWCSPSCLCRTSRVIRSAQIPGSVESETSCNFSTVGNDSGRMWKPEQRSPQNTCKNYRKYPLTFGTVKINRAERLKSVLGYRKLLVVMRIVSFSPSRFNECNHVS